MKSSKGELLQIKSCLEAIQKVDAMIELHRSGDDDFMSKQYESKKLRLFKELLSLLIDSRLNLSEPQTFRLVSQLMKKHYPKSLSKKPAAPEAQPLADLVQSFVSKKAVPFSMPAPTAPAAREAA